MKVMILAAGRGERMRPLTDVTPKPLLRVGAMPLLEWHIRHLAAAGFRELVVNVSHLGQQIIDYCGDGERWQVSIEWSVEPQPLETAGGIALAMPLLGAGPFAVVNSDIWTDYPFACLAQLQPPPGGAHLLLVDNPPQHPQGDFRLTAEGRVAVPDPRQISYTYAGIGCYTPEFFAGVTPGSKAPMLPLLHRAISHGLLQGTRFGGVWHDIGTPERLQALSAALTAAGDG